GSPEINLDRLRDRTGLGPLDDRAHWLGCAGGVGFHLPGRRQAMIIGALERQRIFIGWQGDWLDAEFLRKPKVKIWSLAIEKIISRVFGSLQHLRESPPD